MYYHFIKIIVLFEVFMSTDLKAKTSRDFFNLGLGGLSIKEERNKSLLNKNQKQLRFFTRNECKEYLGVHGATIDKYTKLANIDPRRHELSQWALSIEEVYKVRDLLPADLRKAKKFHRKSNQKLQVIAVQNQKGGVAKTVTAATLASGLATEFHQEYRIGIIDMDAQATLTSYYATKSEALGELSSGDLITGNYELDEGETNQQVISNAFLPTTIPNLRILPAAQSDRGLDNWFHKQVINNKMEDPHSILKNIIDEVESEFDIIIIDTPPSLGFPTYNAYYAATSIIFPLGLTENDIDATSSYFEFIEQVWAILEAAGHPGYNFMKMLITNFREDSNTSTKLLTGLHDRFSEYLYSREFKYSEAIANCLALKATIFDMSKSEYEKSKPSFLKAQLNANEVTNQVFRDISKVWRDSSKVEK